jgi:hypothetical protein
MDRRPALVGVVERRGRMNWLDKLLRRRPMPMATTMLDGYPAPWNVERPSIHGFLAGFALKEGEGLPPAAETLPDEELRQSRSGTQIRWAAGAMDGVLGHHVQDKGGAAVERVMSALESALLDPTADRIKDFYDLVNNDEVLGLVDPLLDAVRSAVHLDAGRLRALARWLATHSPDRAAVKVGIALLGVVLPPQDTRLLVTLGAHEEFTLYAAVALCNSLPDGEWEDVCWSLARRVNGWGRIHLVERLADTHRADIKAWLLREGYKNSVMVEYLAHPCAVGGGLLQELLQDSVDDALLVGAGEIIRALIAGGPAEDMSGYADGAEATRHYLRHVAARGPKALDALLAVQDIVVFTSDTDRDWQRLEAQGWTASARHEIGQGAKELAAHPDWLPLVHAGLQADDNEVFWLAAHTAAALGVDPWDARFERQRAGRSDQWFELMNTDDPARIDRVVELALTQLDLAAIATGPAKELGLGPAYRQHSALDLILQRLRDFPPRGWPLVQAGLRSPVVRNRNMAVRVLTEWDRSAWPAGAAAALAEAVRREPDEGVRAAMGALVAG